MITKHDAVMIGTAICNALQKEQENNFGKTVVGTPAPMDEKQSNRVYGARGCAMYAMDNLWYDVLPQKVKEGYGYEKEYFYKACGWPE